jgi:hypothetical protein
MSACSSSDMSFGTDTGSSLFGRLDIVDRALVSRLGVGRRVPGSDKPEFQPMT